MDQPSDEFAVTAVHLSLKAKIPGADQAKLDAKITMDATLVS